MKEYIKPALIVFAFLFLALFVIERACSSPDEKYFELKGQYQSYKEETEKELYERIQLLEARRLEAEQGLHGHGPGSDLARPEAQTAASTPRERSGPAEALRSSFGDFFRRRTRDSS